MGLLRLPEKTAFPFVERSGFFIAFSLAIFLLSAVVFFFKGLNLGTDFKGGMVVELRVPSGITTEHLRTKLAPLIPGDFAVQEFGTPQDILIRMDPQSIEAARTLPDKIQQAIQNTEIRRVDTIGPKVGSEFVKNGIIAVLAALLAMLCYIWFRFQWRFGICAFLTLVNDCFFVLAFFILSQAEFNETAIVAILITISYSINDTVVVFDRIRENANRLSDMSFTAMLNLSINDTLSRTVWTSATTLVALLALYLFGGPVISAFSLPILVGIAAGTYSSIFIAGPLLTLIGKPTQEITQSQKT